MSAQRFQVVKRGWIEPPATFEQAVAHVVDAYGDSAARDVEVRALRTATATRPLTADESRRIVDAAVAVLTQEDCGCEPAAGSGAYYVPPVYRRDCVIHGEGQVVV